MQRYRESPRFNWTVRASTDPEIVAQAVRSGILSLDPRLGIVALARWLPALRASRPDPAVALRDE